MNKTYIIRQRISYNNQLLDSRETQRPEVAERHLDRMINFAKRKREVIKYILTLKDGNQTVTRDVTKDGDVAKMILASYINRGTQNPTRFMKPEDHRFCENTLTKDN